MTSAERKRRWRRKLYGERYYGTEGDRMEVVLLSDEYVAELEAFGRAVMEDLERRGLAAVLGEVAAVTPSQAEM